MHIHFEEGQIISTNGAAIAEAKRYRTDIYRLRQNKMEVILRFRDFPQTGYSPSSGQVEHTKATTAGTSCTATTSCTRTTR